MEGVKGSAIWRRNGSCLLLLAVVCCQTVMTAPSRKGSSAKGGVLQNSLSNNSPGSDDPAQGSTEQYGATTSRPTPKSLGAPDRAGDGPGFSSSLAYPPSCVRRGRLSKAFARVGEKRKTLACGLGLRQANVVWYIGGERLDLRFAHKHLRYRGRLRYGEFEVMKNGNLRVLEINSGKEGLYHCQANVTGRGTPDSAALCNTIELRIKAPPRPLREMYRRRVVTSGSSSILVCKVRGYPRPTTVWMKDGHLIGQGQDLKYRNLPDGSLVIRDVTSADDGRYYCVATNEVAQTNISVLVTVVESPHASSPTIVKPPRNRRAKIGRSVTLTCVAVGGKAMEMSWEFHGNNQSWHPLRLRHRQTLRTPQDGGMLTAVSELVIPEVSPANIGQYTCTATNLRGSIRATSTLSLTGQPPKTQTS